MTSTMIRQKIRHDLAVIAKDLEKKDKSGKTWKNEAASKLVRKRLMALSPHVRQEIDQTDLPEMARMGLEKSPLNLGHANRTRQVDDEDSRQYSLLDRLYDTPTVWMDGKPVKKMPATLNWSENWKYLSYQRKQAGSILRGADDHERFLRTHKEFWAAHPHLTTEQVLAHLEHNAA